MTVTIELNPAEEAWLNAQTERQGLSPAEVIKKLVDREIPTRNGTEVEPAETKPVISAKSAVAIAYLDARIAAGANASPEEIRQVEEEFEEIKRNLNANRAATGERPVFP